MKYLLILLSISLLGACSTNQTITVSENRSPHTTIEVAANMFTDFWYRLPEEAMTEQRRCVDFAIRHMKAGEECKWQSTKSVGVVKLAKVDSEGCHMLLNTVYYKDKPKYFQENYCRNYSTKRWTKIN